MFVHFLISFFNAMTERDHQQYSRSRNEIIHAPQQMIFNNGWIERNEQKMIVVC